MNPRLRLSATDCIKLKGIDYVLDSQNDESITLRQVDNNNIVKSFMHNEMLGLLDAPSTIYSRGHFANTSIKLRQRNDDYYLASLPQKKREKLLWKETWCKVCIEAYGRNELKMTDASIFDMMDVLNKRVDQLEDEWQKLGAKNLAGREIKRRHRPSASTLRKWVRIYTINGYTALCLCRKKRSDSSYSQRFCTEAEKLIDNCVSDYLSRNRPTKTAIYEQCIERFRAVNRKRLAQHLEPFSVPSKNTIMRRIGTLDPYEIVVQREGPEAARRRFTIYENGVTADIPLERVEIDEWHVDLITVFGELNSNDKQLSEQEKAQLNIGRRWIYVAIDCATRCIVGFRICENPNALDAIRTLEMVTRDKTPIAASFSCESPWSQHGGIGSVVTDQGSAFSSIEFRTAVTDLGTTYEAPPAGVPKLRSKIERYFGTLARKLVPYLVGRTFSNPIVRGDYPSEKWASLTDEELAEAFVSFIVDIYHNSPHAGLMGETPANAWKRLTKNYGVTPPPDSNSHRVVFGTEHVRKIEGHGVRFLGINYNCIELQKAFLSGRQKEIIIKVGHDDLTHISVFLNGAWFVATAISEAVHGLSVSDWQKIVGDIRTRFREEAVVHEHTIERARKRIMQINNKARIRNRVGPMQLTIEQVERCERDLFLGLQVSPLAPSLKRTTDAPHDLLGDVIEDTETNLDDPRDANNEDWTLSYD